MNNECTARELAIHTHTDRQTTYGLEPSEKPIRMDSRFSPVAQKNSVSQQVDLRDDLQLSQPITAPSFSTVSQTAGLTVLLSLHFLTFHALFFMILLTTTTASHSPAPPCVKRPKLSEIFNHISVFPLMHRQGQLTQACLENREAESQQTDLSFLNDFFFSII